MTPLLCALNPGQSITVITNARNRGQAVNIPVYSTGTVRRTHHTAQWGWHVEIRGANPLWVAHVPLTCVVNGQANLYQERRYTPLSRKAVG